MIFLGAEWNVKKQGDSISYSIPEETAMLFRMAASRLDSEAASGDNPYFFPAAHPDDDIIDREYWDVAGPGVKRLLHLRSGRLQNLEQEGTITTDEAVDMLADINALHLWAANYFDNNPEAEATAIERIKDGNDDIICEETLAFCVTQEARIIVSAISEALLQ